MKKLTLICFLITTCLFANSQEYNLANYGLKADSNLLQTKICCVQPNRTSQKAVYWPNWTADYFSLSRTRKGFVYNFFFQRGTTEKREEEHR